MRKNTHITFIGAGNMAGCLINGLIKAGHSAEAICATSPDTTHLNALHEKLGIRVTVDNHEGVQGAEVVVFAVKPQIAREVVTDLAKSLQKINPLIVSVMAGIAEKSLQQWLAYDALIVRVMPNIPSLVACGATVMHANYLVNEEQKIFAESLMRSVGAAWWLEEEDQINVATAIASSGPAYFYALMEAMIKAGEKHGFSEKFSRELVLQTALGSASLAMAENMEVSILRQKVTSPGGGTEQALKVFEQLHFADIIDKAIDAALQRYIELSKL